MKVRQPPPSITAHRFMIMLVQFLGSGLARLQPVRERAIRQALTEFETAYDYTYLSYAAPG